MPAQGRAFPPEPLLHLPVQVGQDQIRRLGQHIPAPGEKTLRLDLGLLVFGNGLHPTTICQYLELLLARAGLGSLGLAVALMEAGHVLAVDLNSFCT